MPRLADVVAVLDGLYDPAWAQPWDAVGLVAGDPADEVRRVLFAVDPVPVVAAEAIDRGADLIVTHHPLFLRGVHGVAATTYQGRLVHGLIRSGIALHVAHTNADVAAPGVSDALAVVLGLRDIRPLVGPPSAAGAPGLGRVGELPRPLALAVFAEQAAGALPATAAGLRVAGELDRPVRTVAVCGGAGDSLLAAATAAGADVYLTADLRHHVVCEHIEAGGPALVDAAHWATEWPWLAGAAQRLSAGFPAATVECLVSTQITDPWRAHRPAAATAKEPSTAP